MLRLRSALLKLPTESVVTGESVLGISSRTDEDEVNLNYFDALTKRDLKRLISLFDFRFFFWRNKFPQTSAEITTVENVTW